MNLVRSSKWIYLVVAVVGVLALAVDPNRHLASENDVYMLRQVQALRELAPWRWNWSEPSQAALQAAFWLANISLYFHGPMPPLLQGIFLDLAETLFGATGTGAYLASTGLLYILGAFAFVAMLRAAGISAGLALLCGLALCASPVWLALSRSFGGSWMVSVVTGHCLAVLGAQLALDRRPGGEAILAIAFANLLVSDVLAPCAIAAVCTGIIVAGRGDIESLKRIALSRWMLLPATCVVWVVGFNAYVITRGMHHPSELILFAYPVAHYVIYPVAPQLVGMTGIEPPGMSSGWSWVDRIRIVTLVFGLGGIATLPAVLCGAIRRNAGAQVERARVLMNVWGAVAFGGFGLIFLFLSGPNSGSQAMPLVGYPIYLLAPGAAMLASGLSMLRPGMARLAHAAAALWIAGSGIGAWIYVWRVPLPGWGALLTVRESTDNVGFRYPDAGIMGAGSVIRAAVSGAGDAAPVAVAAVFDPALVGLRNLMLWRAGTIDGGTFARKGTPCVVGTIVDRSGTVVEKAESPAVARLATRVAQACTADICVGVGAADAALDWRIVVTGEADRSVEIRGYGVPRPAGYPDNARSDALERMASPRETGIAGAPIAFAGMERALRLPKRSCAAN